MKIHFCDLCNESVPQSELDAGRAFMRKGRVVCVKCDQLMTQHEQSMAPQPFAAATPQDSGAAAFTQPPNMTPVPYPDPVGDQGFGAGAHPQHPHHHHRHPNQWRARGTGSGVAVGLFALAFSACAFYWLMEQSQKATGVVQTQLDAIKAEQDGAKKRVLDTSTEWKGEAAALDSKFEKALASEHRASEIGLEEVQRKLTAAQSSVSSLRAEIETIKSIVPSLQRHDEELNTSSQMLSQLEGRAEALETAMADMKKQLENRPAAAAVPAAAPAVPAGTPPWMGLVQQLESANSGDRWVAVQSLGETRDPAVAEYILPRLKDVDIFVRMVAARVLGDLGSPKAIGALIESLGDQDAAVREASYLALCTVSKKSMPFDPHQDAVDRAKKVRVWQDWWKKAQEEGGAQ